MTEELFNRIKVTLEDHNAALNDLYSRMRAVEIMVLCFVGLLFSLGGIFIFRTFFKGVL